MMESLIAVAVAAAVAVAMAGMIEHHHLIALLQQRRHEGAPLRPAPAPAVGRHDRGPVRTAEAPCGDSLEAARHVETRPGGEQLALARRMRMPGRSGIELVRRLRKSQPDLTITSIGNDLHPDLHMAAIRAGVRSFLEIPFAPESLSETLREMFGAAVSAA